MISIRDSFYKKFLREINKAKGFSKLDIARLMILEYKISRIHNDTCSDFMLESEFTVVIKCRNLALVLDHPRCFKRSKCTKFLKVLMRI